MMRTVTAAVSILALTLGGCTSWLPKPGNAIDSNKLISIDFVNALMQIESLHPSDTTVQFEQGADIDDPYIAAFKDTLRDAGYGIQIVSSPQGNRLVKHKLRQSQVPGSGRTDTHEIAVGSIRMRREYQIDANGNVQPASNLFVKGTNSAGIKNHDSIFNLDNETPRLMTPAETPPAKQDMIAGRTKPLPAPADESEKNKQSAAGDQPQPPRFAANSVQDIEASLNKPLTIKDVMPPVLANNGQAQAQQGITPKPDSANGSKQAAASGEFMPEPESLLPITQNMADIGKSNFSGQFGELRNVDEQILTFDNDSLRLGESNKWFIQQAVRQFDPDSDVFSIVGCSLGPTKLKAGNEGLAMGRANRVKQALMFAGVPEDSILEEGCWAAESMQKMPSRGVVLSLKRKGGG